MRHRLSMFLLSILLAGIMPKASARADNGPLFAVLVFSKTAGYRHDSIPAGIEAIRALGDQDNFSVDATEDGKAFNDANLARYREVIFLSTTGEVLDAEERAAFERYVRHGGAFVGIHAATDSGYEWPWYGALVGNYFKRHPAIQQARLEVTDASHPSTRNLPISWKRVDEWYDFRNDPDPGLTILIRIDERSYRGGRMGANHPVAWCHEYDGGRAWYTALGHGGEAYGEPLFREHLRGGILWAAGAEGRR
ncbi:MAG TPA: ThuA domain-containing protein [Burkholderiales bacterium]|nr:ThuA domain-containing protein [Burkholderiales bacterium]